MIDIFDLANFYQLHVINGIDKNRLSAYGGIRRKLIMGVELKESKDGECPHCGSREAKIIARHTAGASEDTSLPTFEWYTCQCLNRECRKEFRILASIWHSTR
jgi:DNA-directed RNA polymerase subunit M/transcription elongation factor TFIIS